MGIPFEIPPGKDTSAVAILYEKIIKTAARNFKALIKNHVIYLINLNYSQINSENN